MIEKALIDTLGFGCEDFVKKAVEGGWKPDIELLSEQIHHIYCEQYEKDHGEPYWTHGDYSKLKEETKEYDRNIARFIINERILFSPLAWQAVGKAEGNICGDCEGNGCEYCNNNGYTPPFNMNLPDVMHRFIDALCALSTT